MDYPEILYQLDENKYYLFLTWLALLLAALAAPAVAFAGGSARSRASVARARA